MLFGDLTALNTWINADCSNLQIAAAWYGRAICVGPQGGEFTETGRGEGPRPTSRRGGE
jgi:hypothetical protein